MPYATGKCVVCGKSFQPHSRISKCCSQECRSKNPEFCARMSRIMKDKYTNNSSFRQQLKNMTDSSRGKTLEELFGCERADSIRKKLSVVAKRNSSKIKDKQKLGYRRHTQAILDTLKRYQEDGYVCAPVSNEFPRPDIVAFKDGKVYALEVERTSEGVNPSKYNDFPIYADIMWHIYSSK